MKTGTYSITTLSATTHARPTDSGAPRTARRLLLGGLLLTLLAGCGASTISIEGNYPTPLIGKLPLTIGVYYPPELREFTYTEIDDYSGKDQYIINTGPSQMELFNTILPVMFDKVIALEEPSTDNGEIDAVFIPTLNQFQLGLPEKTKLDVFEIWLEYNMRLTRPNGDYIADWKMTAYGKSPTETFQSVDQGVQNASEVAMRDLAASFTLGFTEIPDVKEWLQSRSN